MRERERERERRGGGGRLRSLDDTVDGQHLLVSQWKARIFWYHSGINNHMYVQCLHLSIIVSRVKDCCLTAMT